MQCTSADSTSASANATADEFRTNDDRETPDDRFDKHAHLQKHHQPSRLTPATVLTLNKAYRRMLQNDDSLCVHAHVW